MLAVGPVSVVRGDPLGLFERVHRRDEPVDLYVHPRTVPFEGQSLGFFRDLEGLAARDLSPDDVSFHALREYQPGDDLRHVHWRSTARTGTVMVRQYEETRRSHFVLGLSRNPSDYRHPDEFELAISAAGSLGLRAVRDSRRVDLQVQGRSMAAETGKRLLDSLAALEPSRRATAASSSSPERSPRTCRSPPSSCCCAARASTSPPCAPPARGCRTARARSRSSPSTGASPTLRRIGDADVVTIGELEQLPAALRKVLA